MIAYLSYWFTIPSLRSYLAFALSELGKSQLGLQRPLVSSRNRKILVKVEKADANVPGWPPPTNLSVNTQTHQLIPPDSCDLILQCDVVLWGAALDICLVVSPPRLLPNPSLCPGRSRVRNRVGLGAAQAQFSNSWNSLPYQQCFGHKSETQHTMGCYWKINSIPAKWPSVLGFHLRSVLLRQFCHLLHMNCNTWTIN